MTVEPVIAAPTASAGQPFPIQKREAAPHERQDTQILDAATLEPLGNTLTAEQPYARPLVIAEIRAYENKLRSQPNIDEIRTLMKTGNPAKVIEALADGPDLQPLVGILHLTDHPEQTLSLLFPNASQGRSPSRTQALRAMAHLRLTQDDNAKGILLPLSERTDDPLTQAVAMSWMVHHCAACQHYDDMISQCNSAVSAWHALGEHRVIGDTALFVADTLFKSDRISQAQEWFQNAQNAYTRADHHAGMAKTHMGLGQLMLHHKELESAEDHIRRAIVIYEENDMKTDHAAGLMALSEVYRFRNECEVIFTVANRAQEIAKDSDSHRLQARALNRMGNASRVLGRLDRAKQYQQEAMALYQQMDDNDGINTTQAHIKLIEIEQNDQNDQEETPTPSIPDVPSSSVTSSAIPLPPADSLDGFLPPVSILNWIRLQLLTMVRDDRSSFPHELVMGWFYIQMRDYKRAEEHFRLALKNHQMSAEYTLYAQVSLAGLARLGGQYESGERFIDQALTLLNELGPEPGAPLGNLAYVGAKAYEEYAAIKHAMGDHGSAAAYQQAAQNIRQGKSPIQQDETTSTSTQGHHATPAPEPAHQAP
ncbi:MAG: tetratricopeptide repeat protein [Pseudomonadota bacterium]